MNSKHCHQNSTTEAATDKPSSANGKPRTSTTRISASSMGEQALPPSSKLLRTAVYPTSSVFRSDRALTTSTTTSPFFKRNSLLVCVTPIAGVCTYRQRERDGPYGPKGKPITTLILYTMQGKHTTSPASGERMDAA